ncbi:MAG: 50S ribosomal protein L23 [bacterium]
MKDLRDIIKKPLITEKATHLFEKDKYSFKVDSKANKTEIKRAVEEIFKVKVKKVQTMKVPGKPKRMGRHLGRTAPWKKAIVTLEKGQRIPFFEGM